MTKEELKVCLKVLKWEVVTFYVAKAEDFSIAIAHRPGNVFRCTLASRVLKQATDD